MENRENVWKFMKIDENSQIQENCDNKILENWFWWFFLITIWIHEHSLQSQKCFHEYRPCFVVMDKQPRRNSKIHNFNIS